MSTFMSMCDFLGGKFLLSSNYDPSHDMGKESLFTFDV
jgi:hypothetical protein